jgi:ABC-type Fe3+-hydroxamate transport system substrate-binding protein
MSTSFTDQMNNTIQLSFPPKRIVSLVPSQTELVHALGLEDEVVGITKFCVHPEKWFRTKQRIGGTKTIKTDVVKALQPDLIIANKEENVKEQIEELKTVAPVWVSDIQTLDDALQMIQSVGELVNKTTEAGRIVSGIETGFQQLHSLSTNPLTAYLIWKDPYMAAGGDTFINDIMNRCGFDNVLKDFKRYPEITVEQLLLLDCQLLLLSSEPFPFEEKHVQELQKQLPDTQIVLVDGEMFSWYGSRLLFASGYLTGLITNLEKAH